MTDPWIRHCGNHAISGVAPCPSLRAFSVWPNGLIFSFEEKEESKNEEADSEDNQDSFGTQRAEKHEFRMRWALSR